MARSPFPPEIVENPVMLQQWNVLAAIHFRYDPQTVAKHLPAGLTLDLFEGSAWIGIFPFRVERLRPPRLPQAPWISNFPETNLRTYVLGPDGYPGILFFSLDAARLLAVLGARATFGLPYKWSAMSVRRSGDRVEYRSRRSDAAAVIDVEVGEEIPLAGLSAFENFVMPRWRLYTTLFGRLHYAQVSHPPWPLYRARLARLEQTLTDAAGLPRPHGEPFVLYSPGVEARIAVPRRA